MLIVVTALAGCGPSVTEDPIEVREVCGNEGPVRLLNVEVPASARGGATWGSTVIGERRVAAWFDSSASEYEDAFGAYVLDACGGNEIELGDRELPLVVGDAAFVCDPETGDIRPLDVNTGEAGEVLGSGLDCNPWFRFGTHLTLRNVEQNTWSLLNPDGLIHLPFEADPLFEEFNDLSYTDYLSRWGWLSAGVEQHRTDYMFWEDSIVNLSTGELTPAASNSMWVFGEEDGLDMFIVYEPDADGVSQTAWWDDLTSEPRPAFALRGAESIWGSDPHLPALLTQDEVVLVERGEVFPRPALLETTTGLERLDATRFALQSEDWVRVWDIPQGRLLVEFAVPGYRCSSARPVGDALVGTFADTPECDSKTRWSIPLDGSDPEPLFEHPRSMGIGHFTHLDNLGFIAPTRGDGELAWIDLQTGHRQTVVPRIDGLAVLGHTPLPRPAISDARQLEYYIRQGEDAGLWLVGTPQQEE